MPLHLVHRMRLPPPLAAVGAARVASLAAGAEVSVVAVALVSPTAGGEAVSGVGSAPAAVAAPAAVPAQSIVICLARGSAAAGLLLAAVATAGSAAAGSPRVLAAGALRSLARDRGKWPPSDDLR